MGIFSIFKPAGEPCPHLERGVRVGCSLAGDSRRPAECVAWSCAWRSGVLIPDSWRPDRVGVMVDLVRIDVDRPAWQVVRVAAQCDVDAAADVVEHLLATRLPVFVAGRIISDEYDGRGDDKALTDVLCGVGIGVSDRAEFVQ